jgi:hypothetical protein
MHATNGTSIDSSGIGLIQEYEAGPEILMAAGTQDNTSDDNTHGKKQESREVELKVTRNHTAQDNQLKGCVTVTIKRIHGKRKRKSTGKQLITYFLWTLEAPFNPASDTNAHLDISTSIFAIKKLQTCKPKQDSNTRQRQIQPKKEYQGTKYETNKKMDKSNSIMEDHSKHPCQQQRMEQERMKHRIKQTITAFLQQLSLH